MANMAQQACRALKHVSKELFLRSYLELCINKNIIPNVHLILVNKRQTIRPFPRLSLPGITTGCLVSS